MTERCARSGSRPRCSPLAHGARRHPRFSAELHRAGGTYLRDHRAVIVRFLTAFLKARATHQCKDIGRRAGCKRRKVDGNSTSDARAAPGPSYVGRWCNRYRLDRSPAAFLARRRTVSKRRRSRYHRRFAVRRGAPRRWSLTQPRQRTCAAASANVLSTAVAMSGGLGIKPLGRIISSQRNPNLP